MNNTVFTGRFCETPELKQTNGGIPVCSFTLAVDRPNVTNTTDFINFVAWRKTAEFIARYFKKGNKIAVSGALTSRKYQDKDGKNHVAFEVVVERAEFCERKELQNEGAEQPQLTLKNEPQFEEIETDEDLPF